jgi:hypothetical protein
MQKPSKMIENFLSSLISPLSPPKPLTFSEFSEMYDKEKLNQNNRSDINTSLQEGLNESENKIYWGMPDDELSMVFKGSNEDICEALDILSQQLKTYY